MSDDGKNEICVKSHVDLRSGWEGIVFEKRQYFKKVHSLHVMCQIKTKYNLSAQKRTLFQEFNNKFSIIFYKVK